IASFALNASRSLAPSSPLRFLKRTGLSLRHAQSHRDSTSELDFTNTEDRRSGLRINTGSNGNTQRLKLLPKVFSRVTRWRDGRHVRTLRIVRQGRKKTLRTHTLSLSLKPGDLAPSKTSHFQTDLRLSKPRNNLRTLHKRVSLSSR